MAAHAGHHPTGPARKTGPYGWALVRNNRSYPGLNNIALLTHEQYANEFRGSMSLIERLLRDAGTQRESENHP